MTLTAVEQALNKQLWSAAWKADYEMRGRKVVMYRDYVDGDHDAKLTEDLRKLLRINDSDIKSAFTANKCDDVISTMSDRLHVDRIEGDSEAASKWAQELMDWNRFDGMELDVNDATLRDADSYVSAWFDKDADKTVFCHELAWDGVSGMMVVHESVDKNELAAAIKVWSETSQGARVNTAGGVGAAALDVLRINVYYPNRIEKFISTDENGANLTRYDDPAMPGVWPIPWTKNGTLDGEGLGVPVIHFRNKARGKSGFGVSELENVITLQDGKNRLLHSLVFVAENTAYQTRIAMGFRPPAGSAPGSWVVAFPDGMGEDDKAEAYVLDTGEVTPFIEACKYFDEQIEEVSRTPNMQAQANISGEALKQLEIKLIGKCKRYQVKVGNAWEDVMALAARLQEAFGTANPPPTKHWRCRWADPEIRNDTQIVANAQAVKEEVGAKEYLRLLAPVLGYDEKKIDQIIAEKAEEIEQRLLNMTRAFPTFGGEQPPPNGANGNGTQPQPVNNGAVES